MPTGLRWTRLLLLLAAGWAAPSLAQAAFMDAWADVVFGQPDFTHKLANGVGVTASSLYNPQGVALDAAGNLYLADTANNRVLEFDAPLAAGANRVADRVFGQLDYTHNAANNGGVRANSLNLPESLSLDRFASRWVQCLLPFRMPRIAGKNRDRSETDPECVRAAGHVRARSGGIVGKT